MVRSRGRIEMRISLVAIVLLFVIGFGMIRVSEAVTIITLKVDPAIVPGRVGKNITFDISISGIDESVLDLYGWELKLNWTDIDFNFVDAAEGPFLQQGGPTFFVKTGPTTASGNETLTLACTLTGNIPGVRGSGILATVTLYVVGGSTGSPFDLFAIKLRNSVLDPIQPPKYDVVVVDEDSEFARARNWDIEPTFGVVDIYDLAVVAVNYGRNVIRPTKIATTWTSAAGGGWSNPEAVGSSDDIVAAENTENDATKWMSFSFNTTGWTGVDKVEVGLERRIGSAITRQLRIEMSNDNGATWSATAYTHDVSDLVDMLMWIDVTTAYSWTTTMVGNIAVKITMLGTGSVAIQIDYLAIRVTPTPVLGAPEAFEPDADVNNDRTVDIDDLVLLATNYGPYEL